MPERQLCIAKITNDPAFNEEWKMEYLKEREEFSKTGIPTKKSLQQLPTKSETISQSVMSNSL